MDEVSSNGENPIVSAAYLGRLENVQLLRELGSTEPPEVLAKLALWEAYGDVLQGIEGTMWKPKVKTKIRFGNRFQVRDKKIDVFFKEEKVITIPFGIFRKETGEVGFTWKGHYWFLETLSCFAQNVDQSEICSERGQVWERVEKLVHNEILSVTN